MPRRLDTHIIAAGPSEYAAVLRPTPDNADVHETQIEKYNPFPDLVVYLNAKGRGGLIDWARATFPELIAQRMVQFVQTKNKRELEPLTKSELDQLREKYIEFGFLDVPEFPEDAP